MIERKPKGDTVKVFAIDKLINKIVEHNIFYL